MKDNDASFVSLPDSNEKLSGFLDWLLETVVNMCGYITCRRACLAYMTGLLFLLFLGLVVQQTLALTWVYVACSF